MLKRTNGTFSCTVNLAECNPAVVVEESSHGTAVIRFFNSVPKGDGYAEPSLTALRLRFCDFCTSTVIGKVCYWNDRG